MNLNKYSNVFLIELSILSLITVVVAGFIIYLSLEKRDSYNDICGTDITLYQTLTTDLGQSCK
ncbi:hypothetical protein KAR91_68105 [Candidatus Pacearchaeota archaeon]|nr:hypothetical protein [Candidatus Pacearchaeota archaeon]